MSLDGLDVFFSLVSLRGLSRSRRWWEALRLAQRHARHDDTVPLGAHIPNGESSDVSMPWHLGTEECCNSSSWTWKFVARGIHQHLHPRAAHDLCSND